jgi:hypothetical protein
MFFYDPFGRSDPEALYNFGREDIHEHNYILFHDQEPIHLNIHMPSFEEVKNRSKDITHFQPGKKRPGEFGYLCTSECNSDSVDLICEKYSWKPLYYFFHGWAALDWYRGYDKTFLIKPLSDRKPTRTFIAPNRIIAGERQHRLQMLYWIFKLGLTNNHISCPDVCPAENISIYEAIKTLPYNDAESVFKSVPLPIQYAGETDHPMHSCWLSLFDEAADSLLYLVSETVATGRRHHLTEKTFKPIAMGMPFIIAGTKGSLKYLRSYGFKTFEGIWDESYDDAEDDVRIERIASLLRSLDELTIEGRQDLFEMAKPIIEHNWNHFYSGGFEAVLWTELQEMLDGVESSS